MRYLLQRGVLVLLLGLGARTASAATYPLPPPEVDVVGAVATVEARAEETLLDIARANGLGFEDIIRANPDLDPWIPGEGATVVLPTRFILPRAPREGEIGRAHV